MSTTPYPGPDEVIIPSRIYFDEGKRIDVKVWPKTIQLTCLLYTSPSPRDS